MEKRVLFAVLDWGLGHATRSVPILRALLKYGVTVEICTRGKSKTYLEPLFPDLVFHELPDSPIQYSRFGAQWSLLKRAFMQPSINRHQQEKIRFLLEERSITHIISDNVYGAVDSRVKTALITHQLSLKAPILSNQINQKLASWINRFEEVWIPDDPELKLSGLLGQNDQVIALKHYLGLLSQMTSSVNKGEDYEIGVVLGGPEPQRSILEEKLLSILRDLGRKTILFRGTVGKEEKRIGNVTLKDLGRPKEMSECLRNTQLIISRSGYSSIMDFWGIGQRNLFIPTPGQTEQEYLADTLATRQGAYSVAQSKLTADLVSQILKRSTKEKSNARYFNEDSKVLKSFIGS